MIRHRISLKKLQAFSCDMKNEMIIAALNTPEEKEMHHQFTKDAAAYFQEHQSFNKKVIEQFANYAEITQIFGMIVLILYGAMAIRRRKNLRWWRW